MNGNGAWDGLGGDAYGLSRDLADIPVVGDRASRTKLAVYRTGVAANPSFQNFNYSWLES
jgi:hypothetical protein